MSQHFLDVVAKHKQEDHVAKYVPEIDMQELMGDQGERRPKSANRVSSKCYRNDPSDMVGLVHLRGAAARLHEEHDKVYDDQEPHHVRRRRPLERTVIP
jgi:flavin reductase (DIM6/NTAB) family NADH-FMN oxidoreductase RutF